MLAKKEMELPIYRGFIYQKHGRVGTKSEGPDYFLQSYYQDFLLAHKARKPWEADETLAQFCCKMVEIEGEIVEITIPANAGLEHPIIPISHFNILKVRKIREITDTIIPEVER
jgi:hypothetical protein